MRSLTNFIIVVIMGLSFAQCTGTPERKVSPAENAFVLSWTGLQEFQGVLWMFRDKYKINPRSYDEMKLFINKYKLNYNDPFERLEFIASGDEVHDQTRIHYLLRAGHESNDEIPDSWKVEIEADALVNFVSWESSVAIVQGKNIKCKLDDNGYLSDYDLDSTDYYVTHVPEEAISKLKGKK
ncbi:MAG TPA: hypothetical protein VHO03_15595 [Ignavibacteriales bacterium]|nr:hypothetical protein [Ignavibacteriales bacterium]